MTSQEKVLKIFPNARCEPFIEKDGNGKILMDGFLIFVPGVRRNLLGGGGETIQQAWDNAVPWLEWDNAIPWLAYRA